MSSSYLLNLKINQLQQEVQGIGNSVGYFWNLNTTTGLTIDGGDTACNISSPATNDTQWGYSTVTREGSFQLSATSGAGYDTTVMYFGISKDITQSFSGASSPSMAMCDWGVLLDNQANNNTTFLIQNGVRGNQLSPLSGVEPFTILITYDGTTLKFFANGTEITSYRQTVELSGAYTLVCGSFYGGQLNSITWSGLGSSGGGGGSNDNLQMVLSNGNNADDLDILNVGNLFLNKYLNIGNAIGSTSQIHMCWDTGNTLTGSNIQLVAASDGTEYNQFEIQFYKDSALEKKPFKINSTVATFVTEVTAPSYYLTANNNPVLDAIINPPIYFYTINYVSGADTKTFNSSTATSIMSFNLSNLYSFYTVRLDTLIFTLDIMSAPAPSGPITAQFYLSNVLNGTPTNDANFVSFTTGNLNQTAGGSANFSLPSSKILCTANDSNSSTLYLNVIVKSTPAEATTYKLANFNVQGEGQASPSKSGAAPATMLT